MPNWLYFSSAQCPVTFVTMRTRDQSPSTTIYNWTFSSISLHFIPQFIMSPVRRSSSAWQRLKVESSAVALLSTAYTLHIAHKQRLKVFHWISFGYLTTFLHFSFAPIWMYGNFRRQIGGYVALLHLGPTTQSHQIPDSASKFAKFDFAHFRETIKCVQANANMQYAARCVTSWNEIRFRAPKRNGMWRKGREGGAEIGESHRDVTTGFMAILRNEMNDIVHCPAR